MIEPRQPPNGLRFLIEGQDVAAVERLFDRCGDYFILQDGVAAGPEDAAELFRDVPPDHAPAELLVLGREADDRVPDLSVVIALLPDYPDRGIWYLPFMVIDPSERGRGLGRSLHDRLVFWARNHGATGFQLVVLEHHAAGRQFWEALGYRPLRRVGPDLFKTRQHFRIEMRLDFPVGKSPATVQAC